MKKHKTPLCCMLLALTAVCNQTQDNSYGAASVIKREGAGEPGSELHELMLKVEAQLPDGWMATIAPEKDRLFVALKKKTPVEYRSEFASDVLKRVDEQIHIALVQIPFLTPDEYQHQKQVNQLSRQKRLDFEEAHLSHLFDQVRQNHKISNHPFSPELYNPQTTDDKQAVIEFTDLWQNTEPAKLPTHRFENASFIIEHYPITDTGSPHIYIVDEQISRQHDSIVASIESILSKYE